MPRPPGLPTEPDDPPFETPPPTDQEIADAKARHASIKKRHQFRANEASEVEYRLLAVTRLIDEGSPEDAHGALGAAKAIMNRASKRMV